MFMVISANDSSCNCCKFDVDKLNNFIQTKSVL